MNRPNRITDTKDLEYHDKWCSYIYSKSKSTVCQNNVLKSLVNWSFYKNNQWIFSEDQESFLQDRIGNVRNRLKLTMNIIQPLVRRIVGNAIRNQFDFGVVSISNNVANRIEKSLSELLAMTDIANTTSFGDAMRKRDPRIGATEQETKTNFFGSYVDEYAKHIEILMQTVANKNNFDEINRMLAVNLFLDGIGIVRDSDINGDQVFELIKFHNFIYDSAAKKQDLSDGDFWGDIMYYTLPVIAEQYSSYGLITDDILANMERASTQINDSQYPVFLKRHVNGASSDTFPVHRVCWRDVEKCEFGVVQSPEGYHIYTKINHENSQYTDADLIESEFYQEIMQGNLKITAYEDYINEAHFIPSDKVNTAYKDGKNLILRFGRRKYQERESFKNAKTHTPYKVYAWLYDEGDVLSPVDVMIQPQRFINRLASISESHINNSNPSGIAIDEDALSGRDISESEIREAIANGEPIKLRADGNVQNSIGKYPSGVAESATPLFNLMQGFTAIVNDIVGNNEGISGTGTSVRASATVTQNQVFQGTLMQEDFFFALSKIFEKMYQAIASRGKLIYIDNHIELVEMVGDKFASHFLLTKAYSLESFRSFVRRTDSRANLIKEANEQLVFFLQNQMISRKIFAELWNKSTPKDVDRALIEFQVAVEQAQKQANAIAEEKQALQAEASVAGVEARQAAENAEADAFRDIATEKNTVDLIKQANLIGSQTVRNQ